MRLGLEAQMETSISSKRLRSEARSFLRGFDDGRRLSRGCNSL